MPWQTNSVCVPSSSNERSFSTGASGSTTSSSSTSSAHQFDKLLEARPDESFFTTFSKHVEAYAKEGQAPPKAIETAVMNAADDYMAGRDITLRAGDYISVQNFIRGQQKA